MAVSLRGRRLTSLTADPIQERFRTPESLNGQARRPGAAGRRMMGGFEDFKKTKIQVTERFGKEI